MERTTIAVGSYQVNCSILAFGDEAWIVDPGQEGERILALLREKKRAPRGILLTHAHFDHITGIPALQAAYPELPVYVGNADRVMFGHPLNQVPGDYDPIGVPKNLRDVTEVAEVFDSAHDSAHDSARRSRGDRPTVISTPGHTPGGVCYYFESEKLLLSGDTLFAGSCGRTDFPGGSMRAMMDSLKRLAQLPDDTRVIPGHGPFTTIGDEKAGNPYMMG